MPDERAQAMRVLWDKGRNMLTSFFVHLAHVRREVGDERLNGWCIANLGLGISTIRKMSEVLKGVDAKIERDNLREADAFEKARRRAERERKQQTVLERRMAKRAARAAQEARLAAHRGGTQAWRQKAVDNGIQPLRDAVVCGALSLTRGAEIATLPFELQMPALQLALKNPRYKPRPKKRSAHSGPELRVINS